MSISEQDYELLSAYLDDMLEASQRAELEVRLNNDSELRTELNALRQMVQLVRSLPELAAPRSYTLTPEQALKIRSERIAPAAEGRILRLVIPILSAAASMMLVLFGLALLLNSPNSGMTTQSIAMATLTGDARSASASDRIMGTPTVAPTFAMTEVEIGEIMSATDEGDVSVLGAYPETEPETSTGAADALPSDEMADEDPNAEDLSDEAPLQESAPEDSDDQEEEADGSVMRFVQPSATEDEAGGGIFDLLEAPSATVEPFEEEASAPGAANSEIMITSTDAAVGAIPPLAMATNAVPSPKSSATETVTVTETATATETPTPTTTETNTATSTATATPTLTPQPTVTEAPTTASTAAPTAAPAPAAAAPPSQLIGLILVGLGLSLGVITLVIARRARSTGGI